MGCLSACRFSNWSDDGPDYSTGKKADPRSFFSSISPCGGGAGHRLAAADAVQNNLMFSGIKEFVSPKLSHTPVGQMAMQGLFAWPHRSAQGNQFNSGLVDQQIHHAQGIGDDGHPSLEQAAAWQIRAWLFLRQ